ncbi:trans-4-hydroxy-L-proline dehydratase activase [Psychrilyobacter sp.]|uniref:trans-4-hydroxy-L-proline dehydratase activase n=1 Tax=Psychrilyobacter sp. TaxID=2586924 RepID=UPI003019812A
MKGTIVNVQRYSVHDGPGIRTTIFFKGCPLKCWWCHNPENISLKEEEMFYEDKCTGCGRCIKICREEAIKLKNGNPFVELEKCKSCGRCAEFCISGAKEHVGRSVHVDELMVHIKKDIPFYEESGGGVTFSGGEPLMQGEFLNEVLKRCKNLKINTTLDTCGYSDWKKIKKIHDKVDLFLYDLKIFDDEKHIKYTGVSNKLILENLKKLSSLGKNIYVRMPIIKGINDDSEHVDNCVKFLSELNILQVNLLPYHKLGMNKYDRLAKKYKLTGEEKPSDSDMIEIAEKFRIAGIKVKIGG